MFVMSWISKLFRCKKRDQDAPVNPKRPVSVPADNPIKKPEDDALRRSKAARYFAEQILLLDVTEGAVVGVLGAWGSGKTSFVNMARTHWAKKGIPVLEFNPWMFSGTDQLAKSFFFVLSAEMQLRLGLDEVGKGLENFGNSITSLSWAPIKLLGIGLSWLGKCLKRGKEGIDSQRKRVEEALRKLNRPIVVVLDDIDRLTTSEIRDIFKLVRLTANFPNIIYVLAFDRKRVEDALKEQNIPGRAYLEKIMQYSVDLPSVPEYLLTKQITDAIDKALSGVQDLGKFNQKVWPDVFWRIVRPLIKNMRDVRRYVMAAHAAARELGSQVVLVDVLALEAVRVLLPETFLHIRQSIEGLTETSGQNVHNDPAEQNLKKQIQCLIGTTSEHRDVVESLVTLLFPAAERHIGGYIHGSSDENQWLKERRVAHKNILLLYLERSVGLELQAFNEAEQAFAFMANREALENHMGSLDKDRLEDVISSLEVYTDQFVHEHSVPSVTVLLNLLPGLPERQRGMFDFGPRESVKRVVYRLLRTLKDRGSVQKAILEILPKVSVHSSKLELLLIVGHRKDVGSELISKSAASTFEKDWRDKVRTENPDVLARDPRLLESLLYVKRDSGPTEPPIVIPNSPVFTLSLLRSAQYESNSQDFDRLAVNRFQRINWDALLELYGSENTLRERIEALKASQPENCEELLRLADKYLSGWKPGFYDRGDD